jgi:hypothetical protein
LAAPHAKYKGSSAVRSTRERLVQCLALVHLYFQSAFISRRLFAPDPGVTG